MTDYYAYDHSLPCRNPSCKSYGKPHPNCRCYWGHEIGHAEGGEVTRFCSDDRAHQAGCEYFADGGAVGDESDWQPETSAGAAPGADPDADWEPLSEHYGTTGQQVLTGIEGVAQGVLGPIATGAEKLLSMSGVPGLTDQDITARQETNPIIHGGAEAAALAGSLLVPGLGEYSVAAKAARVAAEAAEVAKLGKIGSGLIKGAITSGLIQGSDEVSKAMLGQGDPQAPVAGAIANVGAAALLGAVTGGVFGGASAALQRASGTADKIEHNVGGFLSGLATAAGRTTGSQAAGAAWLQPNIPFSGTAAFRAGEKFFEKALDKTIGAGVGAIAHATGISNLGLIGSALIGSSQSGLAGGLLRKQVSRALYPIMARMAANPSNPGLASHLYDAVRYAANADSGLQKLNRGVESLFKTGGQQAFAGSGRSTDREKLRKYVADGGINQDIMQAMYEQNEAGTQAFAEGGEALPQEPGTAAPPSLLKSSDPIAAHFPEQNILLNEARGRISSYLTAQQPSKLQPRLAFDPPLPDAEATRSYDRALDLANEPLSVLNHVQDGTLLPEHVAHFQAMFPEVNALLQTKLTERITQAQLKDERPSYRVRQGLSMLMGVPLDGTLTPASMQAAQATFAAQRAQSSQQAPPAKNKRGTSSLGKVSDGYLTGDQARQQRQNDV